MTDIQIINALLDSYQTQMIETLKSWISYKSVVDINANDGTPFGKECADMLDRILADAGRLGLTSLQNHANYVATADLCSGEPCFGVACHADVVDANGADWNSDPWKAEIRNGLLFGRGSSDNKSAGVAALYALAALKESGIPCRNVRLYFGSAEEIGSKCLEYYFKNVEKAEKMPPLIIPDAGEEIIYGEWGIIRMSLNFPVGESGKAALVSLSSGEAYNIIPKSAKAVIKGMTAEEILKYTDGNICRITAKDASYKTVTVTAYGKSCHSSKPSDGINAALGMAMLLSKLPFDKKTALSLRTLSDLYSFPPGAVGNAVSNDKATFSLTGLFLTGGVLSTWHDSRLSPEITTSDFIMALKERLSGTDINVNISEADNAHFIDKDSNFIKRLADIFKESTGKDVIITEMRAATYASHTATGVAFGQFEGSNIHSVNESLPLENILKTAKLLANAMYRFAVKK